MQAQQNLLEPDRSRPRSHRGAACPIPRLSPSGCRARAHRRCQERHPLDHRVRTAKGVRPLNDGARPVCFRIRPMAMTAQCCNPWLAARKDAATRPSFSYHSGGCRNSISKLSRPSAACSGAMLTISHASHSNKLSTGDALGHCS
ncbi:hypothetical protein Cyagr_3229 [Cyanobium gracile PCC 6307]|uniref:Uncharacterized protein n=1 Tax=Cyanobium gracile (strain ATCC 27147 / PCC 6307) TaxID=292564 RepID=K9PAA3_CYAGP|nr:hypothetical protein Cyagr_3229 [Cyanobium gracile PCC 6307]